MGSMPERAPNVISNDVHRIVTIIHVALHFRRVRIGSNGKISSATQRVMKSLQCGLLTFLADGLDHYLRTVYLPLRPGPKPPPARVSPKKNKGLDDPLLGACTSAAQRKPKRYVVVDPETMWDMMEDSRLSGASLAQVAVVRRNAHEAGCGARVTHDVLGGMNTLYRGCTWPSWVPTILTS